MKLSIKFIGAICGTIFCFANAMSSPFDDLCVLAKEQGVLVSFEPKASALFGDLTFKKDNKSYVVRGTKYTHFLVEGDILYIANYHPKSSFDLEISKYDLSREKLLWSKDLKIEIEIRKKRHRQRVILTKGKTHLTVIVRRSRESERKFKLLNTTGKMLGENRTNQP